MLDHLEYRQKHYDSELGIFKFERQVLATCPRESCSIEEALSSSKLFQRASCIMEQAVPTEPIYTRESVAAPTFANLKIADWALIASTCAMKASRSQIDTNSFISPRSKERSELSLPILEQALMCDPWIPTKAFAVALQIQLIPKESFGRELLSQRSLYIKPRR